jgi:hypothetical protein
MKEEELEKATFCQKFDDRAIFIQLSDPSKFNYSAHRWPMPAGMPSE